MKGLFFVFFIWFCTSFYAFGAYSVFTENGKVGLKNTQGHVIIPAEYEALGWSNGSFSVIENVTGYFSNGHWGIINLSNQRITKALYEEIFPTESSLIIARKKSSISLRLVMGCINTSGKEVIPFQYDGIKPTSLRAIVFTKIGNQFRHGLIDLENKTLIPQQYQDIRSIGTLRYAVKNFENKTALFADNGKQITDFTIDSLSNFTKNYAILYQGTTRGLIDREGQIKVEPSYRDIALKDDGKILVKELNHWLFLDGQNKLIKQTRADSVVALKKNVLKIKTAGVTTLTNIDFKPITENSFSTINKFNNNKAVFTSAGKQGVINHEGKTIIPANYNQLHLNDKFIIAKKQQAGRTWFTLLDTIGTPLTDKAYEAILPLHQHYFAVKQRGFWGVLNEAGKSIVACVYDSLVQVEHNLIVVKFKNQYGIINFKEDWIAVPQPHQLKIISPTQYLQFKNPTTLLKSIDNNTIYFTDNKIEVHPEYITEYLSSGEVWRISFDGIISNDKVAPAEKTEEVFEESEGLRAIKRNGQYGFVDSRGRLRIANRYEAVEKFNEGLAPIKILGKWGFINNSDNIAVQPAYEEVFPFNNGYAIVKQKGLLGIIDKEGKNVLPVRYETIETLSTKNIRIKQGGLYGLTDETGKVLILPRYDELTDVGNGYVIVQKENKFGVLTLQGLSTVPLLYDYIGFDNLHNFFVTLKKAEWKELQF